MENNKLWEEDIKLFEKMKGRYVSENESAFFETLHKKEVSEPSCSAEQLLLEAENRDSIYILRLYFDEYIIGNTTGNPDKDVEEHVMNLSELLSINMKTVGLLNRDITVHEWLREFDYQGIHYDRNLDFL